MAALTGILREPQRALSERSRLVEPTRLEYGLALQRDEEGVDADQADRRVLVDRLLEERKRVSQPARRCVGRPQPHADQREPERDVADSAQLKPSLERHDAGVHLAAPERDDAEAERRDDEVERMRGALGGDHGLVGAPASLGELAQLDTAPDQPGAGEHRREARLPEALSRALAGQLVDVRAEDVDAPSVFTKRIVGLPEPEVRGHAQREIAE